MPILELLVYFSTPLIAAALASRERFSWLDPVLTCYGVGLLLANLPIEIDGEATKSVTEAVVPLAIPLLLFQTDFPQWLKSSRATLLAFVVAVVSAITSLTVWGYVFRDAHEHIWMATGMFAGCWTGGTPNLVSVGAALEAPQETFLLANGAEVLVGGIYLLMLLSIVKPILAKILPLPEHVVPLKEESKEERVLSTELKGGAFASVLALSIVGVSAGMSMLAFDKLVAPFVILGLTTGGIAASFVPRIRGLRASYDVGNYLILVFCVAIGALTDLGDLVAGGSVFVGFAAVALTTTVVLHFGICRLLKLDTDTAIMASVATIMGPALVPPVAKRLDNRDALVAGITTGLVGYAMGNYIGIALANVARLWTG